tara:strand:- start:15 stop:305 length:291 start_codon:yes stop_codon:yes gene_type:complete
MDGIKLKDGLLTVKEAATLLKISERTIRRWVASGRLDYTKVGRRIYTTIESLELLSERPRQISARAQQAHDELIDFVGGTHGLVYTTARTGSEFRS